MLHTQFYALTRILSQISPQAKLEHFLGSRLLVKTIFAGVCTTQNRCKMCNGGGLWKKLVNINNSNKGYKFLKVSSQRDDYQAFDSLATLEQVTFREKYPVENLERFQKVEKIQLWCKGNLMYLEFRDKSEKCCWNTRDQEVRSLRLIRLWWTSAP